MKKIISILSAFMLTLGVLGLFTHHPVSVKASGEIESYIISPTALAVSSSTIYVADSATGKIIALNKTTKTQTASASLSDVKKLIISGENLFALTKSGTNTNSLQMLNLTLENVVALTFPSAYPTSEIIDVAISSSTVYILRNGGDIDHLNLTGSTLNMGSPSTTATSTLEHLNSVYNDLNSINEHNGKLVLTTPVSAFKLNLTNSAVEKVFETQPSETILYSAGTHLVSSKGRLLDLESNTTTETGILSFTGLSSSEGVAYLTSSSTHQVFKVEGGALQDLSVNPAIHPTYLTANNFIHIKVLGETPLFLEPFSVNPFILVESNTHLTVIGTYGDFYFCMVAGTQNKYLYLDSKSANFETINIGDSSVKFTAIRSNKIYSLPSTSTDEKNIVLGTIFASEDIMVKNSTIIENSKGELFYLVEYAGGFGFVRASFLQSTKGAVELTTPCNARTKRTTTLFENADGTGVIMTIEKGTRISLREESAPTKDYIEVEYQDTNGVVYTGYLLSDDVDPDGLSTLQILGLVLVGTNFALLLTILLIKKRSRKWKV